MVKVVPLAPVSGVMLVIDPVGGLVVTVTSALLPSPQRFQLLMLTAGLSYSKYGLPLHLFPAAS